MRYAGGFRMDLNVQYLFGMAWKKKKDAALPVKLMNNCARNERVHIRDIL